MDHPVRVAFCDLMHSYLGGRFDARGVAILTEGLRGNCDTPFDCAGCIAMRSWLYNLAAQGWEWEWECIQCVNDTLQDDLLQNVERLATAYYQAGRDPNLSPDDPDYDPDKPLLSGCTRCGWQTSFLQLVLRRRPR